MSNENRYFIYSNRRRLNGLVSLFFGGIDHLVKALAIFMAIDYTLGIMVGFLFKNVESKKAFKGQIKKFAMILMVIAAV